MQVRLRRGQPYERNLAFDMIAIFAAVKASPASDGPP
jgi:hypothetical protein